MMDRSISLIWKATKYWVSMAHEPQLKIHKRWDECERSWENINREMKDIGLLEFGSLEFFVDLHDIVKRHAKHDSMWEGKIMQVVIMTLGHVQNFMEHMIKARAVLQCLSAKMIRYREHEIEIKETLSSLMDQHRFPYANTCEDIFVKWSAYEKSHPL
jgi:hypothetical protein